MKNNFNNPPFRPFWQAQKFVIQAPSEFFSNFCPLRVADAAEKPKKDRTKNKL